MRAHFDQYANKTWVVTWCLDRTCSKRIWVCSEKFWNQNFFLLIWHIFEILLKFCVLTCQLKLSFSLSSKLRFNCRSYTKITSRLTLTAPRFSFWNFWKLQKCKFHFAKAPVGIWQNEIYIFVNFKKFFQRFESVVSRNKSFSISLLQIDREYKRFAFVIFLNWNVK